MAMFSILEVHGKAHNSHIYNYKLVTILMSLEKYDSSYIKLIVYKGCGLRPSL